MFKRVLLLLTPLLFSGCASLSPPSSETRLDSNTGYWFSYDATRRGTVLVQTEKGIYSCSEPAPDVMTNLVANIDAKLKDENITAEAKGRIAQSALQLASRTQMVMFLRESLYRLCELNLNSRLDLNQISDLYGKVIKVATDLGLAEVNQAKVIAEQERASAANAQTAAANAQKEAEDAKRKAADAQKMVEQERAKAAEAEKKLEIERAKAAEAINKAAGQAQK
jgi:hypothetical protein